MKFNPYVFRKYDIRGIVEEDFSDIFVNTLGKSFGTKVKRIGIKVTPGQNINNINVE